MASKLMEKTFVPQIPFQEQPQKSANVELHSPIEEQSSLLKYSTLKEFQIKKKSMIDKINEESRQLLSVLVGGTIKAKQEHMKSVIRALNNKYPNIYIMWANESMFCKSSHPVCNTLKLVYFRKKQTGEIDIEKASTSSGQLYAEYKPIKSANKSKTQLEIAEEPQSQDIPIHENIKISNTLKSSLKLVSSIDSPPSPPSFIYDVMEEFFSRVFTEEFQAEFEDRYRSHVAGSPFSQSRIVKAYIPSTMSFEDAISSNPAYFVDFPGKKMEYLSSIVFTHYGGNTTTANSYSFNDFKSMMMNATRRSSISIDHCKAIATLFNSSVQPYNSVIGEYSHEYYKTELYESQSPEFKFACLHFLQQNTIASPSNPHYKSSLSNDLIKILYSENLTTDSYQSILQQFPDAMTYIYELSNTGPENNPFVVKTSGGNTTNVKNVMEFLVDGVLSLFLPHKNNAGIVLPPPNALLGNALRSLNKKNEDTRVGFQVGGGAGSIFFSVAMELKIKIPEDIIIKKTDFDARVYYIYSEHDHIVSDVKKEYTKIIRFLRDNDYFDKEIELELNSRFRPSPDKNYVIKITNSDIKWRHHTTESNFPAELLSIDILYNVQIGYKNIRGEFVELGNYVHTAAIFDIVDKPVGNAMESPGEIIQTMQEKRNSMYSTGELCPIATPVTFIKTIVETLSVYSSIYNRLKTGKISKDYDRVKVLIQMLETYKRSQLKEGVESNSHDIVTEINSLVDICKEESKKGLNLLPELLEAERGGAKSTFVEANDKLVRLLLFYLQRYPKDYDIQLCTQIEPEKLQIVDPYESNEPVLKSVEDQSLENVKLINKKGVTSALFKTAKADAPKSKSKTQKINAAKEIAQLLKQREKEEEQERLKQTIINLHSQTQRIKRKGKANMASSSIQTKKKQKTLPILEVASQSSSQTRRKTLKTSSAGRKQNK